MMLIYNLTVNHIYSEGERQVWAYRNNNTIRSQQILTEQGICYTANNFLALNLSAEYKSNISFHSFCIFMIDPNKLLHFDFTNNCAGILLLEIWPKRKTSRTLCMM